MDRFSFIVIDVSLEALKADSSLHRRFREGGNAIIFNANDFASPSSSEVFGILRKMPALRQSAEKLAAICDAPISSIPTLEEFRAGRNIPLVTTTPTITKTKPTSPSTYIGAFPVLDGKDFDGVLRRVGDKVELVGKIVSVKRGTGKRGRGKGLPYVFINFGPWNGESVKITIWSEGLGNMSAHPSDFLGGKLDQRNGPYRPAVRWSALRSSLPKCRHRRSFRQADHPDYRARCKIPSRARRPGSAAGQHPNDEAQERRHS